MNRIRRYRVDHPSLFHFILATLPIVIAAPLVIGLPFLIPRYVALLKEVASDHTGMFVFALVAGTITFGCSVVWVGRKAWLETAEFFPSTQEESGE